MHSHHTVKFVQTVWVRYIQNLSFFMLDSLLLLTLDHKKLSVRVDEI